MSQKETEKQQTINQFAMIWNYNAKVLKQNNYYGEMKMEAPQDVVDDAEEVATKSEEAAQTDEIVSKLKPIFYGNEAEARNFLATIRSMKATQITNLVNQYVRENKISELSCHRDLYNVLHDYGLYKHSESNWNQQVG